MISNYISNVFQLSTNLSHVVLMASHKLFLKWVSKDQN